MKIKFTEVKEHDKIIVPAVTINVKVTGIYTDIKRTHLLMEQLRGKEK